uniref:GATA-type domain-containing protein n=1 Tax=Salix viminalis TaxID=40686 RepID=A0A6N2N9Z9_SALVM
MRKEFGMINAVLVLACLTFAGIFCKPKMILHLIILLKPIKPAVEILLVIIATAICSNDPLLARRCANCDTTSTPLWRNGPRGPKSLCNACGIRFKKEERRATAANVNNANANASGRNGAALWLSSKQFMGPDPKSAMFLANK